MTFDGGWTEMDMVHDFTTFFNSKHYNYQVLIPNDHYAIFGSI